VWAWRGGPTGVEEQGMCAAVFPRNLGGPAVSAREPERGDAGHTIEPLACGGSARPSAGAKDECKRGTAKRRTTKRGGMGVVHQEHYALPRIR
jgi:hypothetical protein